MLCRFKMTLQVGLEGALSGQHLDPGKTMVLGEPQNRRLNALRIRTSAETEEGYSKKSSPCGLLTEP